MTTKDQPSNTEKYTYWHDERLEEKHCIMTLNNGMVWQKMETTSIMLYNVTNHSRQNTITSITTTTT